MPSQHPKCSAHTAHRKGFSALLLNLRIQLLNCGSDFVMIGLVLYQRHGAANQPAVLSMRAAYLAGMAGQKISIF